jgi:hypothetical protein
MLGRSKRRHLFVWNSEHPSRNVDGSGLLLFIWNARRQGSEVPVNMTIPLLAAQR